MVRSNRMVRLTMAINRRTTWKLLLLSAVVSLLVLAGTLLLQAGRVAMHHAATCNRLEQIELAIKCYYSENGRYPPQYLTDRQGMLAHSWRILILKYIDIDLYRRYSFDEPWNGPHNRLLASEMPEIYRSPFVGPRSTVTQYVGISGKETPWRGTTPLRDQDMRSNVSEFAPDYVPLIWFVEVANSDINWMEPRDIPFEQAVAGINLPEGRGIQSNYTDGLPAQMKPFGCEWVPVDISPEKLRLMLTVAEQGKKGSVQRPLTTDETAKQPPP